MADKEERIYISYYKNNPCENCGKDYCAEGTCSCDIEFARSIPLTKAIEVMAKAIFEWQRPGCRGDVPIEDVWNNEQEGYEKLAEAALNALLEGVKN